MSSPDAEPQAAPDSGTDAAPAGFDDPDVVPVFSQTAYIKSAQPLHDAHFGMLGVSGSGSILVVGQQGAVTVYERDPSWRVAAELTPSPSTLEVGPHVAISNEGTIAVGATDADGIAAIYVFHKSGSTWSQEARIRFTASVYGSLESLVLSSDGQTLVAGSRDASTDAGRIQTFERGTGAWPQVDSFGRNEPLGLRLALAPEGDVLAATAVGTVELYARAGTGWQQRAALPSEMVSVSNWTNIACSSKCRTVAIGNTEEDSVMTPGMPPPPPGTGVVTLFEATGTTWSKATTLRALYGDSGDAFGGSVALSKDGLTLLVGASKEGGAATGINGNRLNNSAAYSGAAYVFRRNPNQWREVMYLKASNTQKIDIFGAQLGISDDGTTIMVAAPYESGGGSGVDADQSDNSAPYAGAVYAFEGTFQLE